MISSPKKLPPLESVPHKALGTGCDVYGSQRLALALVVRDFLISKKYIWFLESGTLLGAWRNGKFIPHDDDFDIGIYFNRHDPDHPLRRLDYLAEQMTTYLPSPYKCRIVTSYCDKLEVFDPSYGSYMLIGKQYLGKDYHHVTVDLQIFTQMCSGLNCNISPKDHIITALYRARTFPWQISWDVMFPCSSIILEGEKWMCPHQTQKYLEEMYGYLGEGARYDETTGKYIPSKHD